MTAVAAAALTQLRFVLEAYAGRPLPDWPAVKATIDEVRLPAGADLFVEDDVDSAYFVLRGLLKLDRGPAKDRPQILAFIKENEFVASLRVLRPGANARAIELGVVKAHAGWTPPSDTDAVSARATAIEETRLLRLDFTVIEGLAHRHVAWAMFLVNYFYARLAEAESDYNRLRFLSHEQRYRQFRSDHPELAARLSQRDLAGLLGVTPAGLSRIVTRVRRETTAG